MNNENKKANQNENDEIVEFRPRNNELILQCATDILFKAGFTPESLLAMNSMQKNMFIDVYLLDILTSNEKTYEEIEGAYHIIDFMIPPEKNEFE
ncbi:MAG: hypothetical protein ACI3U2_01380 [Anaerovibrio sp.]